MTRTEKPLTMAAIRRQIDLVDGQLIKLLAERQRLVEKAIAAKREGGIPARVPERVDQVIDHVRVLARQYKVDVALVESMWTEMIEWFISYEERALK
jgi:isochorismate pyruvate lyase